MSQQIQPVQGVVGGAESGKNNVILSSVGPRFALVPKIYEYAEGCCNPILPQSISIVAVGDIQSPMHLKQVVNQVNNAAQPAPFTSHIAQSTCLCFNSGKGIFSEQQVMDAGGNPTFSLEEVWKCCSSEGCCQPVFSVVDAQKVEVGHLKFIKPDCGRVCCTCLCGLICRSASHEEYAWFAAVDPHDIQRLTFRVPAREGECLLFQCCNWVRPAQAGCCAQLPDIPFHVHEDLYGPMPQPGKIGEIDSRGAYGWDTFCLCGRKFGVRPEMMTTVSLTQNLSFEDTTLAIQMALWHAQQQLQYHDRFNNGMVRRFPFLKPGQVTMA